MAGEGQPDCLLDLARLRAAVASDAGDEVFGPEPDGRKASRRLRTFPVCDDYVCPFRSIDYFERLGRLNGDVEKSLSDFPVEQLSPGTCKTFRVFRDKALRLCPGRLQAGRSRRMRSL